MTYDFTWLVIPDIQAPFHDRKAVQALMDFVRWRKPDGLLCVGDEIDLPSVSRWTKSTSGEHERSLRKDCRTTAEIVTGFRDALGKGKPFHMSRSNHGDRLDMYVKKFAPALAEFVDEGEILDIPKLIGYDRPEMDVTFHRRPFEFHKGWVLCHGDEGGLSPLAGRTAANLANGKFGKSVVCGHTHRRGTSSHTTSVNGVVTRTVTGMEVGHLMDLKQADYLGGGSANWQQGFGLIVTNGKHVSATDHPIHRGAVILRGAA